jgi:adenosylmethionine-8-amino-7-oxononanoate aminotransferase
LHTKHLVAFADDNRFSGLRQCGTIAALDLRVADEGYLAGIGPKLYAFFLARGLLIRPLGNTIYLMPPYCIGAGELAEAYDAISAAADEFGAR